MFGRVVGAFIGLLVLATGFGLWKPQTAAGVEHVVDFAKLPLAGFDQYRSLVAWLIMAVGLAVVVAALQREPPKKSTKLGVTLFSGDEPAQGEAVYAEEGASPVAQDAYAHEPVAETDETLAHAPAH
jgi:hypothetical protein